MLTRTLKKANALDQAIKDITLALTTIEINLANEYNISAVQAAIATLQSASRTDYIDVVALLRTRLNNLLTADQAALATIADANKRSILFQNNMTYDVSIEFDGGDAGSLPLAAGGGSANHDVYDDTKMVFSSLLSPLYIGFYNGSSLVGMPSVGVGDVLDVSTISPVSGFTKIVFSEEA